MSFFSNYNSCDKLYKEHLLDIKKIKFTQREIDVISCIIHNRSDKKISSILYISPRTVSSHVYNIMNKISCSSKDMIIDFVEKSKYYELRLYYIHLRIRTYFEDALTQIKKFNKNSVQIEIPKKILLDYDNDLIKIIKNNLEYANFQIHEISNQDSIFDISKITQDNYYFEFLEQLKPFITPELYQEVLDKFKENFDLFSKMIKFNHTKNDPIKEEIITLKNKNFKKHFILGAIVIFSLLAFKLKIFNEFNFLNDNHLNYDEREIINSFLSDIKSHKFSPNNLSKESLQQNFNSIINIKSMLEGNDFEEIRKTFEKNNISSHDLAEYLYYLHSLSIFYHFHECDGKKSREISLYAKNILEKFINSRKKEKVDFNKLSENEILQEMSVVENFPQIYVKILYSIGRSYLYDGNYKNGEKYFKLTEQIGKKLNLFESYLSTRSGMLIIYTKMSMDYLNDGNLSKSKEILKKILHINNVLINDDNMYIMDFNPSNTKQNYINPTKDLINKIICFDREIYSYYLLIKLSKSKYEKLGYLNEVKKIWENELSKFKLDNENFSNISSRKLSSLYNSLSFMLFELLKNGINDLKFCNQISNIFALKNIEETTALIEVLLNESYTQSRSNDYTKIDAADGLVTFYQYMYDNADKNKKNYFSNKIHEFKKKRESINIKFDKKLF